MKIIAKEFSWIPAKEIVVVEATEREEARFGTFFGTKLFWMKKGERRKVRVPKADYHLIGDKVDLSYLVLQNIEAFVRDWTWD